VTGRLSKSFIDNFFLRKNCLFTLSRAASAAWERYILRKQLDKLRRWAECSDGTELPERDGKAEVNGKKSKVKRAEGRIIQS